jgi:type IV secretory pathway VirB2 component (pilin)
MAPQGSGAIANAATWVTDTLVGPFATSLAVIAVASAGLMMLGGRVNWRRGARVILGCFILFGSSAIAQGLIDAGRSAGPSPSAQATVAPLAPTALPQGYPAANANPFDPYSSNRPN